MTMWLFTKVGCFRITVGNDDLTVQIESSGRKQLVNLRDRSDDLKGKRIWETLDGFRIETVKPRLLALLADPFACGKNTNADQPPADVDYEEALHAVNALMRKRGCK